LEALKGVTLILQNSITLSSYSAYAPGECVTHVIAWIAALFPHKTAVIPQGLLIKTALLCGGACCQQIPGTD
jgi:hypothetical protein